MALAKLGLLHLLGRLYEKVLMPGAVYDEVVLRGM
jgi:predicted nucleic acid-binding protein